MVDVFTRGQVRRFRRREERKQEKKNTRTEMSLRSLFIYSRFRLPVLPRPYTVGTFTTASSYSTLRYLTSTTPIFLCYNKYHRHSNNNMAYYSTSSTSSSNFSTTENNGRKLARFHGKNDKDDKDKQIGETETETKSHTATTTTTTTSHGKKLLIVGLLALITTIISFVYQKDLPREFLEELQPEPEPTVAKVNDNDNNGIITMSTTPTPEFSPEQVQVIFVLGGPGAGKGTQCAKLVSDYQFVHLSAGDLLRAEQTREGSEYGDLIRHYIAEGMIVPQEITVALLKNAIEESLRSGKGHKFLVDGFPRKMDQAITFEESVVPGQFVLFFDCPEEVMEKRLLKRGETSGRSDDNLESIKKRFRTFVETSMPVVEYFEKLGKVVRIPCDRPVDEVYLEAQSAIKERLTPEQLQ